MWECWVYSSLLFCSCWPTRGKLFDILYPFSFSWVDIPCPAISRYYFLPHGFPIYFCRHCIFFTLFLSIYPSFLFSFFLFSSNVPFNLCLFFIFFSQKAKADVPRRGRRGGDIFKFLHPWKTVFPEDDILDGTFWMLQICNMTVQGEGSYENLKHKI